MGADTASLSGLAKDVFEKGVSEGVNNSFPLADFFPVDEDIDWRGGNGHRWVAHVGRNVSPMFSGEDTLFADAGSQTHKQGVVTIRKMTARIRMTEEAMEDLVSSEASFVNGMTDEKTRLIDDVAKREEFALSNDGKGIFALINGAPSGTTLTLDSPGNIAGANYGNRYIQKGMFLGAVAPSTGLLRAGMAQVVAVASDGTTATTAASINAAWADNDYIVQVANTSVTDILDTSYQKAYWGLPAIIDDSTNVDDFFGVSRTDFPSYKSYVLASAGAISLDLWQRTSDIVNMKLGGEVDAIIAHHDTRREYIKLLEADRRYSGASLMKPDGGTAAMKQGDLSMGEVPVKAIRSLAVDQVYFLDTKKSGFKRYVAEPGKFVDRDGSIWVRSGTGTSARHAFEAWWFSRKQYFVKEPGYNARHDAVTGQTIVVVRDE